MSKQICIEKMLYITGMIAEAQHELVRCKGWSEEDVQSPELYDMMEKLNKHLNNAKLETSSIILEFRRKKQASCGETQNA